METPSTKRGVKAACINTAVATHVVLTKATPDDVLDMFASVGVPMPASTRGLHKMVDKVCDNIVELNQTLINENQILTQMAVRVRDPQNDADSAQTLVSLMLDGHYDVRTKGRSFSTPANFCDIVALETETRVNLPLSYLVYSKFGGRSRGARSAVGVNIASCESEGAKQVFRDLHSSGVVQGKRILRDGDCKISAAKSEVCAELGIQDFDDDACVVHVNRNIPNKLWKLYTTGECSKLLRTAKAIPECYPDVTAQWTSQKKYQKYKTHLIDAIRRRCVAEFAEAHKAILKAHAHLSGDVCHDPIFIRALQKSCRKAAKCLVLCFTGDHGRCSEWSHVCRAHAIGDYTPSHLPNGAYVQMTKNDKKLLFDCVIQAKLGADMVKLQSANMNTNPVESRWKSSDKGNEKGVTHIRNHVAHSTSNYVKHSTGRGLDKVRIAQVTGVPLTGALLTRAMRKNRSYDKESSEEAVKRRRRNRGRNKENRKPILKSSGSVAEATYVGKGADFAV